MFIFELMEICESPYACEKDFIDLKNELSFRLDLGLTDTETYGILYEYILELEYDFMNRR